MEIRIPLIYTDDIPANDWLSEIGLQQYTETFLVNMVLYISNNNSI